VSTARQTAVAFVLALSLGSCATSHSGKPDRPSGSGDASSSPVPAVAPVAVIRARESDAGLRPKIVRVRKAGLVEVRVTNSGRSIHGLQIDGPNGVAKTRPLEPGQSATLRADLGVPGEYEWYSPVANDSDKGIRGVIVVAEKVNQRHGSAAADHRGGAE
jgi:hypothetical protein